MSPQPNGSRDFSSDMVQATKNFKSEPERKNEKRTKKEIPSCPHQKIIDLYHEILPELPRIKVWNETRKRYLQAKWKEDSERQNLEWWENYFKLVKKCPFLLGQIETRNGTTFRADLEWLIRPNNFAKVLEGKYLPDTSSDSQKKNEKFNSQQILEDCKFNITPLKEEFARQVIDIYHNSLKILPRINKLGPKIVLLIENIRKNYPDFNTLEAWKNFFEMVKKQPYLLGINKKHWQANLYWLLDKNNFEKVLNGFYLEPEHGIDPLFYNNIKAGIKCFESIEEGENDDEGYKVSELF